MAVVSLEYVFIFLDRESSPAAGEETQVPSYSKKSFEIKTFLEMIGFLSKITLF